MIGDRKIMEKFVSREEFLKVKFEEAHKQADLGLTNTTKSLAEKGCCCDQSFKYDFRKCNECEYIRNYIVRIGDYGLDFSYTKEQYKEKIMTQENMEKCHKIYCEEKRDKFLKNSAQRFHKLKGLTYEEWLEENEKYQHYDLTKSGRYVKSKEYHQKQVDKLIVELEEVKKSYNPCCSIFTKPFDWSTKIVFASCEECIKSDSKWNGKEMVYQSKEECYQSKKGARIAELANKINDYSRKSNISFEEWLIEDKRFKEDCDRDNRAFYAEMKSLGCLGNLGWND